MHISRKGAIVAATAILSSGAGLWASGATASASTLTCTVQPTIKQAAPAVSGNATVTAAPSGSYVVNRTGTTTLAVSGTPTANSGWTASVSIASGTKVRVVYHSTSSSALNRYTTKLNTSGTTLLTHVVACS